jgi:putative SOS response-associated peptidase YedK
MVRPAAERLLELVPVSPAVGRVGNDGQDLQTPIGPALRAQD